jgi:hypothetical protein
MSFTTLEAITEYFQVNAALKQKMKHCSSNEFVWSGVLLRRHFAGRVPEVPASGPPLGLIVLDKTRGNAVFKLSVQCSKFMNHFTERTENFQLDYSISGA